MEHRSRVSRPKCSLQARSKIDEGTVKRPEGVNEAKGKCQIPRLQAENEQRGSGAGLYQACGNRSHRAGGQSAGRRLAPTVTYPHSKVAQTRECCHPPTYRESGSYYEDRWRQKGLRYMPGDFPMTLPASPNRFSICN